MTIDAKMARAILIKAYRPYSPAPEEAIATLDIRDTGQVTLDAPIDIEATVALLQYALDVARDPVTLDSIKSLAEGVAAATVYDKIRRSLKARKVPDSELDDLEEGVEIIAQEVAQHEAKSDHEGEQAQPDGH